MASVICSKRLAPYLPELVRVLEQYGELHLDAATKARVLALSPATADRLLQAERKLAKPHGLGTTKPGTVLKSAIPIRTFAEWDEAQPGFTEIDLVAHCGPTTRGEYLHSLTVTDPTWPPGGLSVSPSAIVANRASSQHSSRAGARSAALPLTRHRLG